MLPMSRFDEQVDQAAFLFCDTDLGVWPGITSAMSMLIYTAIMSVMTSQRERPDSDPGLIRPSRGSFPRPQSTLPASQFLLKLKVVFAVTYFFSTLGAWSTGSAQTASGTPSAQPLQQVPAVISPVPPMGAPQTSGLPANIITPTNTNRLAPGPELRSSATRFSTAGSGLPGMPGGPPLNGPLGARDPSARFMRPPTVGPLFCDPAVDMSC
jgi:hypothetical protein